MCLITVLDVRVFVTKVFLRQVFLGLMFVPPLDTKTHALILDLVAYYALPVCRTSGHIRACVLVITRSVDLLIFHVTYLCSPGSQTIGETMMKFQNKEKPRRRCKRWTNMKYLRSNVALIEVHKERRKHVTNGIKMFPMIQGTESKYSDKIITST